MSYQDDSNFDDELKRMEADVSWRKERQRKSREELISKIDQRDNSKINKMKNGIKRKLAPAIALLLIIGISTTLIINENNFNNQTTGVDDASTPKNASPNEVISMNNQDLPYEVSEETEQKINDIIESGFDMRLPLTSISEDMYIINTHKRTNGELEEVATLFGYQDDKQFRLSQESITPKNETINQRLKQIKEEATETLTLENGMEAYVNVGDNGNTLYILPDNYAFVLHSHSLATEQIIALANSLELGDLE
jgi:hypothetical protein